MFAVRATNVSVIETNVDVGASKNRRISCTSAAYRACRKEIHLVRRWMIRMLFTDLTRVTIAASSASSQRTVNVIHASSDYSSDAVMFTPRGPLAVTDTFVMRNSQIVLHSFGGKIQAKNTAAR